MFKLLVSFVAILMCVPCLLAFVIALLLRPLARAFMGGFYFVDDKVYAEKTFLIDEVTEEMHKELSKEMEEIEEIS